MTNDPIEVIRDFIQHKKDHADELLYEAHQKQEVDKCNKALAALETVRENYLPMELLPDGWVLRSVEYNQYSKMYAVVLDCFDTNGSRINTVAGVEPSPSAAFLAAVKQIGDV